MVVHAIGTCDWSMRMAATVAVAVTASLTGVETVASGNGVVAVAAVEASMMERLSYI